MHTYSFHVFFPNGVVKLKLNDSIKKTKKVYRPCSGNVLWVRPGLTETQERKMTEDKVSGENTGEGIIFDTKISSSRGFLGDAEDHVLIMCSSDKCCLQVQRQQQLPPHPHLLLPFSKAEKNMMYES